MGMNTEGSHISRNDAVRSSDGAVAAAAQLAERSAT